MMAQEYYISLSQVHVKLCELLGSQTTAEVLLLEALRSGRIEMTGDYYMNGRPYPERILEVGSLRDERHVIWSESRIEHKIERSLIGPKGQTHFYLGDFHRVRLRCQDVSALWPDLYERAAIDVPASNPEAKNKGGRPGKYEWAAAGGALAGHMYGAGIQESSKLKLFMLNWFQSQLGKTPDERDVEKFVAAALAAFDQALPKG
ncbi:hypothetical protein [Methylobacterium longum]|uniref:Uncharacterized protein n=1 Tax=Methylobacterium longum TaxID=767694 RepID=A0ABT8ARB0_9HYPH|nr:hypothetical protein [Methylobacterium longum]MDN3572081.1 hypothetical protein [Methylobacterium longum]